MILFKKVNVLHKGFISLFGIQMPFKKMIFIKNETKY